MKKLGLDGTGLGAPVSRDRPLYLGFGRWGLVAVLLPAVLLIHISMILVIAWPFDREELVETSEPLTLIDVRGDEIATFPAVGADRTQWTASGSLRPTELVMSTWVINQPSSGPFNNNWVEVFTRPTVVQ